MPYIGKEPVAGNFVLLDSITTSATATYALTKDSVAYSPESARNMIVSLNGVTQAPEAAFTVSGSNITFSSALTSSDVIDYILVLGDVLSVGTPSDGTVGTSQMSYPLGNFSSTGIDDNATSTAITIDSSENVGIGTTSPLNSFVVAEGTGQHGIELAPGTTSYIQAYDRAISDYGDLKIDAQIIQFGTDNGTERMRIDSSGNVIIGDISATFNNTAKTVIRASDNYYIKPSVCASFNRTGTDGDILQFYKATALVGSIGVDSSSLVIGGGDVGLGFYQGVDSIVPYNSGTNTLRDDAVDLGYSSGRWKDIYLSGGAYLGGTGAGNYLDDYEEGSWEPTLLGSTANPTVTYSGDTGGFYIKIGRLVFVTGTIRTTAISGGSGTLFIGAIPFVNSDRSNGDNADGVGSAHTNIWNGTGTEVPTFIKQVRNDSKFYVGRNSDTAVSTFLDVSDWGSTCMMSFSMVYYTA